MHFDENMETYVEKSGYKVEMLICTFVLVISVLLDQLYGDSVFEFSSTLIILLQEYDLSDLTLFCSYFLFFLIFLYPIICYVIRNHIEVSLIMLMQTFALIYFEALFKLIYTDTRPIFVNEDIRNENCLCDYGKPSGHSMISVALPLLIISDLNNRFRISRNIKIMIVFLYLTFIGIISFSRLYLGHHSLNQIYLGWIFGISVFIFLKHFESKMQKYVIWPLIYKDRFREKKTIFYMLFLILITNYLLMVYWVNVFTNFEYSENKFWEFRNCRSCLTNLEFRFSSNALMRGLPFNIFFGMLTGMYLSKRKFSNVRIQWESLTGGQRLLKFMVYIAILSLEIFAFFPKFQGN